MDIQLRAASAEDEPFLERLFREVRAPEFAPLGMPAAMLEPLLQMQYRGQTMGYAAQFPRAEESIVLVEAERAGRLLVSRGESEIHLVDIALLEQYRGRGIGRMLLEGLCAEARGSQRALTLSVREGSRAEGLYRALGFVRTGSDGVHATMALQAGVEA